MPISRAQIDDMLRVELARPKVQYARARLASLLHEPRSCLMEWQYGDEGPFEAWVVGRSGDGEIELVWCDQGLGEGAYSPRRSDLGAASPTARTPSASRTFSRPCSASQPRR